MTSLVTSVILTLPSKYSDPGKQNMTTVLEDTQTKPGETIVSAKGVRPWAGMGTTIEDDGMTSKEALTLAKLDWEVEKYPAGANIDGTWVTKGAEDMFKVVRSSDNRILGQVGERYTCFQNSSAFLFGDDIIDSSEAHWIRAGSLKDGATVWMVMEMPDTIKVDGYDDETLQPFLFVSNSHDGGSSVTAGLTFIRLVCNNAVNLMITGSPRTFKIRHTKNMMTRMHEAKRVLGIAHTYTEAFQAEIDKLVNTKFSDKEFDAFLESLAPTEDKEKAALTRALDRQEEIKIIWKNTPDLQNIRNTAYGALQAVVDYHDHYITGRGDNKQENRFRRILTNRNLTHQAHELLVA